MKAALGSLAICAALSAAACSFPNKPITTAAAAMSEPFSDAEILQFLATLNNGEIRQAELAMQRSQDPNVRQAAEMILNDHSQSNRRIQVVAQSAGVRLEETPLSRGMRMQASKVHDQLAERSGRAFDCAFLQKQAEQHAIAAKTVRERLIPDAKHPQVRELVAAAAPRIEQHLEVSKAQVRSVPGCDARVS